MGPMKVLYVTTKPATDARVVLVDLLALEPQLEIRTVEGAAGALFEIRTVGGYGALVVSPSVPHKEALALISNLRRDRTPIAIVAVITDTDRAFFPLAMTAGADDVLLLRGERLIGVEQTRKRIRQSRHVVPEPGQTRLRLIYAGQDEQIWTLISEVPFVQAIRTSAAEDGTIATTMSDEGTQVPADMLLIDERPGEVHPLQVVKWCGAHASGTPLMVLTSPAAGDVGGAAIELGADEIVSKTGTYRRRLVASLHRVLLRRLASEVAPGKKPPARRAVAQPTGPQGATEAEIDRLTIAVRAAEKRMGTLSETAQSATSALTALRAEHDQLREEQAFERALRDRDREKLAAVTRELREERDRRIVLESTLVQTEDHDRAERAALQEDVATAADRLHQVAHNTQSLQARLERQLADRVVERDRLTDSTLIGHSVLTRDGELVRCSDAFASMLGYTDAAEAIDASARGTFPGTPDHAQILARLDAGDTIDRLESTLRRADGRPIRVLTSATWHPGAGEDEPQVERLVVDLSDQAAAEIELRLARRLEAAGRLAAEMATPIETAVASLEQEGHSSPAQRELALLVKQLVAFSRHQAKPAGFLSLNDAIARAEPALRQIAGGAVEFHVELGNVEPVTAGEDDLEHLLIDVVSAAAGCLPFGGRLTLTTSSGTDSTFVLRTTLSVTAAGYGVLPCVTSPSLVRHTARCAGSLRVSGEAGRSSTLHVHLPC
jgi:DNA-binding NarL/FixJ family response regulator/PAS domain-containing protein